MLQSVKLRIPFLLSGYLDLLNTQMLMYIKWNLRRSTLVDLRQPWQVVILGDTTLCIHLQRCFKPWNVVLWWHHNCEIWHYFAHQQSELCFIYIKQYVLTNKEYQILKLTAVTQHGHLQLKYSSLSAALWVSGDYL